MKWTEAVYFMDSLLLLFLLPRLEFYGLSRQEHSFLQSRVLILKSSLILCLANQLTKRKSRTCMMSSFCNNMVQDQKKIRQLVFLLDSTL